MLPPQSPGLTRETMELQPPWECPDCKRQVRFTADLIDAYFGGKKIVCPSCSRKDSPWGIALTMLCGPSPWGLFYPLGATTTVYFTKLFLNTETRINLHDHGLPEDAIILDLSCSPSRMFCMEMSSNSRRQRPRGAKLQLFAFQTYTVQDKSVTEGEVNIAVTWVRSSEADFSWNNLVAAFDEYASPDFRGAIVPANVSIEYRLFNLMSSEFGSVCNGTRLKDFLERAATYSYQLNVLLPYVANRYSFPPMDDHLRGCLNRLRDLRNDLAHRGHFEEDTTKESCAELLVAAVFAFRYIDRLRLHIERVQLAEACFKKTSHD